MLSDARSVRPLGTFSTVSQPKRRGRYGEVPGMLWVILLFDAGVHCRQLCSKSTEPGRYRSRKYPVNGPAGESPKVADRGGSGHICGRDGGMMMEGRLSVATIEALNKILRTCRNMRH